MYQQLRLFGSEHGRRVLVGTTFKINGRNFFCGRYDGVKRRLAVIVTYYNLLTVSYVTQRALFVSDSLFHFRRPYIRLYKLG